MTKRKRNRDVTCIVYDKSTHKILLTGSYYNTEMMTELTYNANSSLLLLGSRKRETKEILQLINAANNTIYVTYDTLHVRNKTI